MVAAAPDEAVFRVHLTAGGFLLGQSSGRWRLVKMAWPHAVFGVRAKDGVEFGFRFDCQGYPKRPPTARPWDIEKDAPLAHDRWPKGQSRIPLAFNPNFKNGSCLYLPCDRQSIEGHANWQHEHPSLIWDPSVGIVHYLRIVHDLLNSGDYIGRGAAA
jgi:hypothetical protein